MVKIKTEFYCNPLMFQMLSQASETLKLSKSNIVEKCLTNYLKVTLTDKKQLERVNMLERIKEKEWFDACFTQELADTMLFHNILKKFLMIKDTASQKQMLRMTAHLKDYEAVTKYPGLRKDISILERHLKKKSRPADLLELRKKFVVAVKALRRKGNDNIENPVE